MWLGCKTTFLGSQSNYERPPLLGAGHDSRIQNSRTMGTAHAKEGTLRSPSSCRLVFTIRASANAATP